MMRRVVLAAAVSLALVGCDSMAPRHERPVAPVAAAFPNAVPATAPAVAASDLDWQQFFGDARLKRLIALALQNNRDLRAAALNIELARAQFDIRRADQLPTVNAGLSASRQPTASGGIASLYTAGVLVTAYELDLFGRVRSLGDVALAQYLATEEARKAVHIALVGAVANAHLALQADDELLQITRDTLQGREASQRLVKLRLDNGAASLLDLRQAESLTETARAALAQQMRQRSLDENALTLLLGGAPPADLPSPQGLSPGAAWPELAAGVPSEVLIRRPDVRQAEQQLIAANANIGAARAAFFPRITLTGSIGRASGDLQGLWQGSGLAWSFAPQLLQPIFDAGRNQANLKAAEVSRELALVQYERTVQTAFREVADALAGRATLQDQLQAQQAQERAERERTALTELRYRSGAASHLELLDAQRSLFAAQQARVQVHAQLLQNLVTLYRVLGGGWSGEGAGR